MSSKAKAVVKKEIIKSNNLIEGSYRLTTSENRLIDLALTKLEVIMLDKNLSAEDVKGLINQRQFDLIDINVSDYRKEYGIRTNNIYQELSETAKRLYDRSIGYIEDDKLVEKRWVITCEYNESNNSIGMKFHPDLIVDLMVFKSCYTRFDFDVKKYIKSYYTCRIYELLKQYQSFGTRLFTIDQIRFHLGIESEEYPKYANLKQKVLLPAIEQINSTTDIYCEMEEIKNKNKTEKIKFKFVTQNINYRIKDTEQVSLFDGDEVAITSSTEDTVEIIEEYRKLLGCTVTMKQINNIINMAKQAIEKHGLDIDVKQYIREKKAVADKYAKKNQITNGYLSIIISSIRDNWTMFQKNLNGFHNFKQRGYENGELKDIESKLREWENNIDEEDIEVEELINSIRNKKKDTN